MISSPIQNESEILLNLKPCCICLGIRLGKVIKAVNEGAKTFQEISKKTGIGRGQCGATRCGATVKRLLEERNKTEVVESEEEFTPKVIMKKSLSS